MLFDHCSKCQSEEIHGSVKKWRELLIVMNQKPAHLISDARNARERMNEIPQLFTSWPIYWKRQSEAVLCITVPLIDVQLIDQEQGRRD